MIDKIIVKVKLAIKESTKEALYQELTKKTWNWWIQQFPRNYCYFYLGQHINIQNLYTDKTKQLFNKKILQQLEHFVRKNNLTTQAQAIYQIHTTFQNRPEILHSKAIDMKDTSTIDTIESLSIIQRTPSKPLDIMPSDTKSSDITLIGHHQRKNNLYNNLVHYSQLGTEDLNMQSQYTIDFEPETETNNKGKQKLKQYSRTTPNTPILPKTTAKHLQTPEQRTSVKLPLSITPFSISLVQPQTPSSLLKCFFRPEDYQPPRNSTQQQEPISTSANIIDYLQKNESNYSKSLESKETESEQKKTTENKEEMATAYIAKIPEFTGEDNNTSLQEWLDKVQKAGDANGWIAARMLKFENLEEPFENWQAFKDTNDYYSDAQILDQFIAGLKNKLIKKVCPHAPADLATAIRHAKNYEMAMEKANHTKLVNIVIGETSLAAEEKIDQLTKKVESYFTNQQQQQQQPQRYQPPQQHNQNSFGSSFNNQSQNCYYCGISGHWKQDCKKLQRDQQNRSNQHYSSPQQSYYQSPPPTYYLPRPQNQNTTILAIFTNPAISDTTPSIISSTSQKIVFRNSGQQRPNYFHTQPSYLTITEELNFQHTALFESEAAVSKTNSSNHTILPVQIAQNANLSNIFPFEFEANESPFLLSNAAANEQKAITAMYTEATVEGKPICLILDSGSAGSIITYQLIPAQTVIVTANSMKKTPVGEIDDFLFTIDGITIPVKVQVMDASQYQALVGNDWLLKANANLDWETQELKISYQKYTIVSATCGTFNKQLEKAPVFEFKEEKKMLLTETYMALGSTSNWAEETEQKIFEELRE
ncbi:hypothetical protein G9A89_004640 [Geosiphon pyriformis]|nr:hypothetical protein G9A89_004640 [Geosiphon pyriformis]